MRRYLLVVPFLIACGGSEMPPADSAAAAPAGLTDADVAGTWSGTVTPDGLDSAVVHWTQVCSAGTCRITTQEAPGDTVTHTYTIAADSVVGVSAAFTDTTIVKGATIVDHWVGRVNGSQVTGTGFMTLADRPDSVVMRYRFSGSRNP